MSFTADLAGGVESVWGTILERLMVIAHVAATGRFGNFAATLLSDGWGTDFVSWFRDELDREGTEASPRRQRRSELLFRRTVEPEVAFVGSAYDPDPNIPGGGARW